VAAVVETIGVVAIEAAVIPEAQPSPPDVDVKAAVLMA